MQAILVATGSKGDLFPFLVLGKNLAQRGNRVLVITQGIHEEDVVHAGLRHIAIFSPELEEETLHLMDCAVNGSVPMRKVKPQVTRLFNRMAPQRLYSLIQEHRSAGPTVVASNDFLANGAATLAREKLGIGHAAIWVTPWNLRWTAPWLPRPARKFELSMRSLAFRVATPSTVSRYFKLRRDLGLPPGTGYTRSCFYSAQRHICLFPRWIVPWFGESLSPILFSNFPRYQSKHATLSESVERFLNDGPPPAVVGHASWRRSVSEYLRVCTEACRTVGLRVILISDRHLPGFEDDNDSLLTGLTSLPDLLPRSAILIHHGGLGTMVEGIAAQIPQLAIPYVADQPFNARTLQRLKVGYVLKPKSMRKTLPTLVARLCQSPQLRTNCKSYAERLTMRPKLSNACEALEEIAS